MGTGASFLMTAAAEDETLLDRPRKEIAELFAKEFEAIKDQGLTQEQVAERFLETLKKHEQTMLTNIATSEIVNKPQPSPTRSESQNDQLFAQSCQEIANEIISKGAHTFLFCTDGSDVADVALKSILHLRKKHDTLIVFHASKIHSDSVKDSPSKREHGLKQRYEPQLIDMMPRNKYKFHFEERYNRTVLRTLQDYLENAKNHRFEVMRPDFLVLGYVGRKGPKEQQTVLGSTADLALRSMPIPCIICKKPCPVGTKSYMMAVKPGEHSKRGLEVLYSLMNHRDTLRVVYVKKVSDSLEVLHELKTYYEAELKANGPADSEFLMIAGDSYATVVDAVLDQINGPQGPDFFALAPHAQLRISSVSEDIIARSRTSIILCKV